MEILIRIVFCQLMLFVLVACSTGAGNGQDTSLPSVALTTTANSVQSGDNVRLTWISRNANSCVATGGWSGTKNRIGSQLLGPLTVSQNYILTCTNTMGSVSDSVSVAVVSPDAATLSFSSDANPVDYDGVVTLSWSTRNVDACSASGDWNGSKATSGTETVGPLISDSQFNLSCSGSGGDINASVTVQVNSAASPVINFMSSTSNVSAGDNVTLSWNATGAETCTAADDWSGNKAISGSEVVGPLNANSNFTLNCVGAGGASSKSLSVSVLPATGDGINGFIDSSYINRLGVSQVYVYAGTVEPDDKDGDSGDPLLVVDVSQAPGTCNFNYAVAGLSNGSYTLAFTAEGETDIAGQDDPISFKGVYNFTYSGNALQHDIVAANILRVGANQAYQTVQAAAAAATAGDVIEVDAGNYPDDIIVFRTNNLTVRGVGGRAHISGTYVIPFRSGSDVDNGMGLWVNKSTGLTVENIEFSNARVADENGAGIRNQGRDLTICNSYFHNNEDGFLGGAYGTLLIEYSEFYLNGWTDLGRNHNMYIDEGDRFILRHSYSHHARIGHNVKTRARENHILYNRIMDETDGTASYAIDVPNGGLTYVIGNLLQQGPDTDNSTLFPYGAEGLSGDGRTHQLYVVNNTLVNDRGNGTFINISGGTEKAVVINNIFAGGGGTVNGATEESNNIISADPGLVDRANYDYRLTAGSIARDAGIAPGQGAGLDLTPVYHYVHPSSQEDRPRDNSLDIGAYEYAE